MASSLFQMYTFIQLAQLYSWQIISDKHRMQTNSSFFTAANIHPHGFELCAYIAFIIRNACVRLMFRHFLYPRLTVTCSLYLQCAAATYTHYKQGSIYYVYKTRDYLRCHLPQWLDVRANGCHQRRHRHCRRHYTNRCKWKQTRKVQTAKPAK